MIKKWRAKSEGIDEDIEKKADHDGPRAKAPQIIRCLLKIAAAGQMTQIFRNAWRKNMDSQQASYKKQKSNTFKASAFPINFLFISSILQSGIKNLFKPSIKLGGSDAFLNETGPLGIGHNPFGIFPCFYKGIRITKDIRNIEVGQPMLPNAKKLAGASKFHIFLGKQEAITAAAHDLEPFQCLG